MASTLASIALSTMDGLLSLPWVEEVLIIASVSAAFILTHKIGVASIRREGKGCKLQECAEDEDEEEEEEEVVKPRSRVQAVLAKITKEVARRSRESKETGVSTAPASSVEVPGVTDKRFVGRIVAYKADEGYGFISCPELHHRFKRDVFLHRLQIGSFEVGATVTFGVFMNKAGQPQAKDLAAPAAVFAGWAPCNIAFGPLVQPRAPLNPRAQPFKSQAEAAPEATEEEKEKEEEVPWDTWWDSVWEQGAKKQRQEWKREAKATWGEKKWVPKATSTAASNKQGKLQWVPKRTVAAGSEGEQ